MTGEPSTSERTIAQWAYGAVLGYWSRWCAARMATTRARPRRAGTRAVAFALAAAAASQPSWPSARRVTGRT